MSDISLKNNFYKIENNEYNIFAYIVIPDFGMI